MIHLIIFNKMHASISRMIIFTPSLLEKFISTNSDICEYIYEDPYDHICRIDLRHKYLNGDTTYKKFFDEMNSLYPIFDSFRSNPRVVLHHDVLYLQFQSEYESLRILYPDYRLYLENNLGFIENFIEQCLQDECIKKYFLENFIKDFCSRGIIHGCKVSNGLFKSKAKFIEIFTKKLRIGINEIRTRRHPYEIPEIATDLETTYTRKFIFEFIYFIRNGDTNSMKNKLRLVEPTSREIYGGSFYKRVVSRYDSDEVYDRNKLIHLRELAKSFMSKYDCVVSGSAALAFFNLELENCNRQFMPDDIDLFFTDKNEYDKCAEEHKSTAIFCMSNDSDSYCSSRGRGGEQQKIIYIPYEGAKINILYINKYEMSELDRYFDIEFCALKWDGNNFDKSSNRAIASAKYGISYQSIDTNTNRFSYNNHTEKNYYIRKYDRIRKYEKRGYKFIFYTNDVENYKCEKYVY